MYAKSWLPLSLSVAPSLPAAWWICASLRVPKLLKAAASQRALPHLQTGEQATPCSPLQSHAVHAASHSPPARVHECSQCTQLKQLLIYHHTRSPASFIASLLTLHAYGGGLTLPLPPTCSALSECWRCLSEGPRAALGLPWHKMCPERQAMICTLKAQS